VPEDSNLESRFEALRKEFVNEFRHTREITHRLLDDLTAISGYAEIMIVRGGPENTISELRKILDRAKKSMGLLQNCISNLDGLARKH
jgi:uncharacterized protein (DUF2342 family)